MRHRQPKGPETDRPVLNHRVTSRLYIQASRIMPARYNRWFISNEERFARPCQQLFLRYDSIWLMLPQ
jgi:hypothetical protein